MNISRVVDEERACFIPVEEFWSLIEKSRSTPPRECIWKGDFREEEEVTSLREHLADLPPEKLMAFDAYFTAFASYLETVDGKLLYSPSLSNLDSSETRANWEPFHDWMVMQGQEAYQKFLHAPIRFLRERELTGGDTFPGLPWASHVASTLFEEKTGVSLRYSTTETILEALGTREY